MTRRKDGGVYGVAGGALDGQSGGATWAANEAVAAQGAAGEKRTALMLDRFARESGVAVLHDLMIPSKRITANIDHLVISGSTVHVIDSKAWKAGRYWTLFGATFRGLQRFHPAEKQGMKYVTRDLERFLAERGIDANFATPVLHITPSVGHANLRIGWLRVPGAKSMTPMRFAAYCNRLFGRRMLGGGKPADPRIVTALSTLLVSKRGRS